jgi:hypothetical protein
VQKTKKNEIHLYSGLTAHQWKVTLDYLTTHPITHEFDKGDPTWIKLHHATANQAAQVEKVIG